MSPELSRRLAQAARHGMTMAERRRIVAAAENARAFADLPADVQRLVVQIETRRLVG